MSLDNENTVDIHDSVSQMVKVDLEQQELLKNYPPEYGNPSKKSKYEEALSIHKGQNGKITISRWKLNDKKDSSQLIKHNLTCSVSNEYFKYEDVSTEDKMVFYLNYADPNLFGYYDGDLFTQDEIQTLEHPLLGSVMEYIDKNETDVLRSRTEEKGEPTPYVVENVPYWICVNINSVLPDGKILNLYGRLFSQATKDEIDLGIKPIQDERRNNIIAMAAPTPTSSSTEYKRKELEKLLKTVLAAFGGAKKAAEANGHKSCHIHTGNWGAGAFGNNRELIYFVQMIGASSIGIQELIFHSIDQGDLKKAQEKYNDWKGNCSFEDCLELLMEQHYTWGNPDGN
ncbi:MAG: hypothetical protein K6G00_11025 [Treponema sp.]|nr:hypothetical protein [Treponema sp.]